VAGAGQHQQARARRAAGELETDVLAALWSSSEAMSAGQVCERLGTDLAYNTVQTILVRLLDKGLVVRESQGRMHLYRPAQGQADLAAEQMHALLDAGADHLAVLQRFVSGLSGEDAARLRALVAEAPPREG
jgi:predicted transcriptional regulator